MTTESEPKPKEWTAKLAKAFSSPTIYAPTLAYECVGAREYSSYILYGLVVLTPYMLKRLLGFGWLTYIIVTALLALPIGALSLLLFSWVWPQPTDQTCALPNQALETYMTILDKELKAKYHGMSKIPMEVFFESYFDGDIDLAGDALTMFEQRYDWATFEITWRQAKFFLFQWIPELLWHSKKQDETQVRDHYDRGDDFYAAFLGDRMVYTSGLVGKLGERETLEQLQDNKLRDVCERMQMCPGDRHLDIGCGWGTLAAYAAKHYGTESVGVTLGRNQTAFGNARAAEWGVGDSAKILCMDYRDIPRRPRYKRITCLEMAEHVGVRKFQEFLLQVRDMLEDDGLFYLQIAGLRGAWQCEDFVWGLFMAKYVFPGADASCPLNWVVGQLETAGFEVRTSETIGIHYSVTIGRWYENWMKNKDQITKTYGKRWFRIWEIFLAWSVIIARQGSSTCYQILAHKNRNGFDRSRLITKPMGAQ
ncbi:S-adenosyl-L-methionine-dependent methyltransferase [Linderina pennispora]|uniref:sphingolipid C(9)-methyltransferase n=1 Tax=Linderina pennispora TaxID=61395 RepID=A0A1Y1W342_9FUNG|nr:S-adenosyl-L-methionine-dependent methyltransferase [Linderina pennispora]ORX67959.1 S-adenosyl-L-methionine-dependent methyltransferase [Linderina pennispora]